MLVELAIGDAYGAGFEFAPPEFVAAHNTARCYVQHPKHAEVRPGRYTDDTQLSIALAELLLAEEAWTAEAVAERFLAVYRRDGRVGYSRRTRALLQHSATGADLLAAAEPGRDTSGAAMRAGPLGVLPEVEAVLDRAELQARVTHDAPVAVAAAQVAALAVHYCYHRLGPTAGVARWVTARVDGSWERPWRGPVGPKGETSVRATLTALTRARGLRELLHACVAYTGDVDTVATIALAAGSAAADLDQDLPESLRAGLENGPYGRDYLTELDARLVARYPPPG